MEEKELDDLILDDDNDIIVCGDEPQEEVVVEKKKRGRKPKDKIYFGEKQEIAVKKYLQLAESDDMRDIRERNEIYNDVLAPAFKKMVEAIIRGKNLYIPNEEFEETYSDTLSHLIDKFTKYNPDNGTRAFSYYSNLCKNYLIGKRQKYQKMITRNLSYDNLEYEFSNDIKYSNTSGDKSQKIAKEEVALLIKRIQTMIDNRQEYDMKDAEISVGNALINLFENWDYVLSTEGSDKLIKSVILLFLREETGLDTKGVRDNLKKFKKEFLLIKDFVIS